MKSRLFLICLLLITTACGFHLRGSLQSDFNIANVYIQSSGASKLEKEVKYQLSGAGVNLASSAETASYVLNLKQESFEKTVLSVSAATGKVEEYQLVFKAKMDAVQSGGKTLARDDNIRTARDFTFDEDAVLGKFSEETIIQEDLVRLAANQVLRRLQALAATNK
ncbi:MAG: LPS assembly lipoprotein LptE [Proteobacteria bacterium]|nr:LPS assembly lipoprotein LptE [Pseudomonadota bacterium]